MHITQVASARAKESDRLAAMAEGLTALGCQTLLTDDALRIDPAKGYVPPQKIILDAQADHRLAMVFGVLASVLPFPVAVRQAEAVVKTFPDFWLQYLGMHCPAHLHPKAMRVDLPQLTPYQQKWQALLGPVFAQVSADSKVLSIMFAALVRSIWATAYCLGLPGVGKTTLGAHIMEWIAQCWSPIWGLRQTLLSHRVAQHLGIEHFRLRKGTWFVSLASG